MIVVFSTPVKLENSRRALKLEKSREALPSLQLFNLAFLVLTAENAVISGKHLSGKILKEMWAD